MEIIDTHAHFWEPDRPDRPWDPEGTDLGPTMLAEQLLAEAKEAGVTKVVQVTPTITGYDNQYSFECAERYPDKIIGVFARFDPIAQKMPVRLDALSKHPKFLGARLTLISKPYNGWLAAGTLDAFFEEAAKADFPVALSTPRDAAGLARTARKHRDTRFLSDHMTLRHSDEDPFEHWADVLALAAEPNVWLKVDCFSQMSRGESYPYKSMQRRFQELFERFGPDKLMWGSNYPPTKKFCTYKQSVDFSRVECEFLSESDKRKFFAETFLSTLGSKRKLSEAST